MRHMFDLDVMLYSVISVVFFCGSYWVLIQSIKVQVPAINTSIYSKKALKVKKIYTVFSWSVMTSFLLGGLVMSFYQVFTQL
jgi:hypothetical protein